MPRARGAVTALPLHELTRIAMTAKPSLLSRPLVIVLAGAALACAASGCGGGAKNTAAGASGAGQSGTQAAVAEPSKAVFVAKANAICEATNGPLTATALKLATQRSPAEAAHIVAGTFIPEIKAQLGRIRALGTPAGGEVTIATMDQLLAGDIAKITKHPSLAGAAAFHDFAQVAHRYGLTACAPLS
jgi:hypothetical protein